MRSLSNSMIRICPCDGLFCPSVDETMGSQEADFVGKLTRGSSATQWNSLSTRRQGEDVTSGQDGTGPMLSNGQSHPTLNKSLLFKDYQVGGIPLEQRKRTKLAFAQHLRVSNRFPWEEHRGRRVLWSLEHLILQEQREMSLQRRRWQYQRVGLILCCAYSTAA